MRLTHKARQTFHAAGIADAQLDTLTAFKASERKDDPARRTGLHGPYEELVLSRTGRLPEDYYAPGDETPWGLRIEESRSNIVWQVMNRLLDHAPSFAAEYLALAIDTNLDAGTYAKELGKLHADWRRFNGPHVHHTASMGAAYRSVACPACSVGSAVAFICEDTGRLALFQELQPLDPQDRIALLTERGLLSSYTQQMKLQIPGM